MRYRIALISEHASPLAVLGGVDSGGQNVYVAQVAMNLAEYGHQVDVFTRRDRADLPAITYWENGVRIIHVPAGPERFVRKEDLLPHMADFTEYVRKFFCSQKEPYHLIHANFWMSGMVALEMKRMLAVPFVITFHALGKVRRLHQGAHDEFPDVRFEIEEEIVSNADRIIAECSQDHEDLITLYHADPERIVLVPCGVDPREICPIPKAEARKYLGLPLEEKIILQLGRMVPRKGVDNVIEALAFLIRRFGQPVRLLVVGGDSDIPDRRLTPELGRLENVAKRAGVEDMVSFAGRRARNMLRYYYSAADVFVSTPWYEPFGMTVVEAMACGTPVIGSNVGGIKYTVADGETGFLVDPKDPQQLANRLEELFTNAELMERFSIQAIHRANQLFTWEKVCQMLEDVYAEVTGNIETTLDKIDDHVDLIRQRFEESIITLHSSRVHLPEVIAAATDRIIDAFSTGQKVMVCGNGGSAADAQHFAGELVGRFQKTDRPGLPVLSLNTDPVILTAWANDFSFEDVYARQVKTFGQPGDILLGISTSGRSRNLIEAFRAAREMNVFTIALLGDQGGPLRSLADLSLLVPSSETARIQEVQMLILHLIAELVEDQLLVGGAGAHT